MRGATSQGVTPAYAETTAWIVTSLSGVTSGVILGAEHELTLGAMIAVSAIAGAAVAVCRRLILASRESRARG